MLPGPNQPGQGRDEAPIGAHCRHAVIRRDAPRRGEAAIVAVEFDERLRMLGDERDRRDDDSDTLAAGALEFLLDRWSEPGERSDSALKTHPPVEPRPGERRYDCCRGALDLTRVGVTRGDDLERQPMRAE